MYSYLLRESQSELWGKSVDYDDEDRNANLQCQNEQTKQKNIWVNLRMVKLLGLRKNIDLFNRFCKDKCIAETKNHDSIYKRRG